MSEREDFIIPRRIPYVIVITLFIQAASALIWATQLDARVNNIEQQFSGNSELNEEFARLDERLDAMKHQLDKITDKLLK